MGAVIDREAELERLSREIRKLNEDLTRAQGKLSNPNFVDKAHVISFITIHVILLGLFDFKVFIYVFITLRFNKQTKFR